MKKQGIPKKYLIASIAVLFLLVYGRLSYMVQYYYKQYQIYKKMDEEVSAVYVARYITSPDGRYELGFSMQFADDEFKDINVSSQDLAKREKDDLIYLDLWRYGKVEFADGRPVDFTLEDYISWEWVGDHTINIEGRILDVTKDKYDFRTDW